MADSNAPDVVGQDITTNTNIPIYPYNAPNSLLSSSVFSTIDTVPSGTDLGNCTNVVTEGNGLFGYNFWLQFDAPPVPLGNNQAVTDSFSVRYQIGQLNANGTPVNDDYAPDWGGQFSDWITSIFGSIETFIWILAGITVILVVLYVWFNVIKKGKK